MVSQGDSIFVVKFFKGGEGSVGKADHCCQEGMGINHDGPCIRAGSSKLISKGLTRQKQKISPGAVGSFVVPGPKDRGKLLPEHRKKILCIREGRNHTALKRLSCPDLITALEALRSRSGLEPACNRSHALRDLVIEYRVTHVVSQIRILIEFSSAL